MNLKKITLYCCVLCITYIAVEALSAGAYYFIQHKAFSFSDIENRRDRAFDESGNIAKGDGGVAAMWNVPHPYLGVVYNKRDRFRSDPLMSAYGLPAEEDPMAASADPHNAIIAITGGSFSERFFRDGRNTLRQKLQNLPAFHDKKIVFIMLGRGAYQQPQQVLAVVYYLVQGGRLDMLINIDGFNETLNGLKNHKHNTYPAFPPYWGMFFADYSMQLPQLAQVVLWKQLRRMAATISKPLNFSITTSTLWIMADSYLDRRSIQANDAMLAVTQKDPPYVISGPDVMNNVGIKELVAFETDFWQRGSLQLYNLSKVNGFYYFHFLQPNQYDKGSKILTNEEKQQAYLPETSEEALCVIYAYPSFKARVPAMQEQGINAYDMTGIYKKVPETLYVDTCCHVNKHGSEIMAVAVGDKITQYLKTH